MNISLFESKILQNISILLYRFLPGSGSQSWVGHISFKTIAANLDLDEFWNEGSKLPMITHLLENTYCKKRTVFESLIIEIVREGLYYCQKKYEPVSADEIIKLHHLLNRIGVQIGEFQDPIFIKSLKDNDDNIHEHFENIIIAYEKRIINEKSISDKLDLLHSRFDSLRSEPNRQMVGIEFQKILNELFMLYNLKPRKPFRLTGEEIDGAFLLDNDHYLLEAKWHKTPSPVADLMVFQAKISGKSTFTRGVFVSINGISDQALKAISMNKKPSFFVLNGEDIYMTLSKKINFKLLLRQKRRILAEEGLVFVPFEMLYKGSRNKT